MILSDKARGTLTEGLWWTLIGAVFAVLAWRIPPASLGNTHDPGPRLVPLGMAIVLCAGGLWQVLSALADWRRNPPVQQVDRPAADQVGQRAGWRAAAGVAAISAYAVGAWWAGFSLATIGFAAAWLIWFRRPLWQVIVCPLLLTLAIVILFGGLFEVQLPRGWSSISVRGLPIDIP